MTTPARAAERTFKISYPRHFRPLGKRASIQPTRFDLRLALRTSPHKKRHLKHPHEGYKVTTPGSGSGTAEEGSSPKSHRKTGGWRKSAFSAETPLTVERKKAREQKLKHRRVADSVLQSHPLRYESSRYSGSLAVSAAFKRDSVLPQTS